MTVRFFPLIANRLAELAHIPEGATVLNVQFGCGNVEYLGFGDAMFDAVLCAASLSLLTDMSTALKECRRVTKPSGAVAFSVYAKNAFQPLSDLYEARIRSYGVNLMPTLPVLWQPTADPEKCHDLLREAGFENIEVRVEQLGYYLRSGDDWWDIVWNSGFRDPVSQLSPEQLARFRVEHLTEVGTLATPNGIWLDVPAIFALGRKLATKS